MFRPINNAANTVAERRRVNETHLRRQISGSLQAYFERAPWRGVLSVYENGLRLNERPFNGLAEVVEIGNRSHSTTHELTSFLPHFRNLHERNNAELKKAIQLTYRTAICLRAAEWRGLAASTCLFVWASISKIGSILQFRTIYEGRVRSTKFWAKWLKLQLQLQEVLHAILCRRKSLITLELASEVMFDYEPPYVRQPLRQFERHQRRRDTFRQRRRRRRTGGGED